LESREDELRRKGAFFQDEHVEVVSAYTVGVDDDGTITGEAEIRRTPYHDPEVVPYSALWMPSDSDLRALHRDDVTRVPEYLETEVDTRQEIIDECPISVFTSTANRFWGWPDRLFSYYEASELKAESGETIMVDSGCNRWGSPTDVLEAAATVDADLVVATDVTGREDPTNRHHNDSMPTVDDVPRELRAAINTHADDDVTVESVGPALEGVRRFMDEARRLGICDRTILPVQAPYVSFLELVDEMGWLDDVRWVAVGGLLGVPDVDDRIAALRDVRAYVGDDMKIHALAPGRDPEMMLSLRDEPALIDSLDNSTPERAPANDQIADATGDQNDHLFPRGEKVSVLRGAAALTIALETAHLLSPNCNVEDTFPELVDSGDEGALRDGNQQQINEWAADD
jgi:hypothetical protein